MLQFYFLSILLNLTIGLFLVLSSSNAQEDENAEEGLLSENDNVFSSEALNEDGGSNKKKNIFSGIITGGLSSSDSKLFCFVFGLLAVFTSFIKLLSPVHGIPFLGDLLPAVSGFAGGACVLLSYYYENSSIGIEMPPAIQSVFINNKKYIGVCCVIAAFLHFILPGVLFL